MAFPNGEGSIFKLCQALNPTYVRAGITATCPSYIPQDVVILLTGTLQVGPGFWEAPYHLDFSKKGLDMFPRTMPDLTPKNQNWSFHNLTHTPNP